MRHVRTYRWSLSRHFIQNVCLHGKVTGSEHRFEQLSHVSPFYVPIFTFSATFDTKSSCLLSLFLRETFADLMSRCGNFRNNKDRFLIVDPPESFVWVKRGSELFSLSFWFYRFKKFFSYNGFLTETVEKSRVLLGLELLNLNSDSEGLIIGLRIVFDASVCVKQMFFLSCIEHSLCLSASKFGSFFIV